MTSNEISTRLTRYAGSLLDLSARIKASGNGIIAPAQDQITALLEKLDLGEIVVIAAAIKPLTGVDAITDPDAVDDVDGMK
jgi:hypothetical protein